MGLSAARSAMLPFVASEKGDAARQVVLALEVRGGWFVLAFAWTAFVVALYFLPSLGIAAKDLDSRPQ